MRTLAERERRLEVARIASRIEIAIGAFAIALPLLLYLFPPSWIGQPMFRQEPTWRPPIELIALALAVIGFVWMLRIRFRGPEGGARSNWRSH
jgi:hypothetical protein